MKKIVNWITRHIRPHFKYKPKNGEGVNISKDSPKEVMGKIEEQSEVGIKFTFKF